MYRRLMSFSLLRLILLAFTVLALISCGDSSQTTDQAAVEKSAAQQEAAVPAAKEGIVKSIQNTAGYTYIEVDIRGQNFWMATSTTMLKPGEKIVWSSYAMMKDFPSKSLGRVFPQIMFVDKVLPASAVKVSQQSGRVVKTIGSAGYTYIQVDKKGDVIWLAAPVVEVAVGQNISWSAGSAMKNFSSRSLDRTFKEIFFVSGIQLKSI